MDDFDEEETLEGAADLGTMIREMSIDQITRPADADAEEGRRGLKTSKKRTLSTIRSANQSEEEEDDEERRLRRRRRLHEELAELAKHLQRP